MKTRKLVDMDNEEAQLHLQKSKYRHTSNISHTLVCNKTVDHSDVVRTSPVGAAPTTISSFSTWHLASMDWVNTTTRRDEKHFSFWVWCGLYRDFTVYSFLIIRRSSIKRRYTKGSTEIGKYRTHDWHSIPCPPEWPLCEFGKIEEGNWMQ